ncbi:uncharacterized protein J3D65DRAFT_406269 [Phyllosticta citribraziliensis]|uniref:Uncharacterized protein n=1 Tax=Phyllosticta citribraziliensis TaxID=989973 RepID=A0ABR1LLT7_9PEZI
MLPRRDYGSRRMLRDCSSRRLLSTLQPCQRVSFTLRCKRPFRNNHDSCVTPFVAQCLLRLSDRGTTTRHNTTQRSGKSKIVPPMANRGNPRRGKCEIIYFIGSFRRIQPLLHCSLSHHLHGALAKPKNIPRRRSRIKEFLTKALRRRYGRL